MQNDERESPFERSVGYLPTTIGSLIHEWHLEDEELISNTLGVQAPSIDGPAHSIRCWQASKLKR